ncbi:hypothetical protein CBL_00966 [Carabus blaptoides fortunei]
MVAALLWIPNLVARLHKDSELQIQLEERKLLQRKIEVQIKNVYMGVFDTNLCPLGLLFSFFFLDAHQERLNETRSAPGDYYIHEALLNVCGIESNKLLLCAV